MCVCDRGYVRTEDGQDCIGTHLRSSWPAGFLIRHFFRQTSTNARPATADVRWDARIRSARTSVRARMVTFCPSTATLAPVSDWNNRNDHSFSLNRGFFERQTRTNAWSRWTDATAEDARTESAAFYAFASTVSRRPKIFSECFALCSPIDDVDFISSKVLNLRCACGMPAVVNRLKHFFKTKFFFHWCSTCSCVNKVTSHYLCYVSVFLFFFRLTQTRYTPSQVLRRHRRVHDERECVHERKVSQHSRIVHVQLRRGLLCPSRPDGLCRYVFRLWEENCWGSPGFAVSFSILTLSKVVQQTNELSQLFDPTAAIPAKI